MTAGAQPRQPDANTFAASVGSGWEEALLVGQLNVRDPAPTDGESEQRREEQAKANVVAQNRTLAKRRSYGRCRSNVRDLKLIAETPRGTAGLVGVTVGAAVDDVGVLTAIMFFWQELGNDSGRCFALVGQAVRVDPAVAEYAQAERHHS
jgi:hypothetical protein